MGCARVSEKAKVVGVTLVMANTRESPLPRSPRFHVCVALVFLGLGVGGCVGFSQEPVEPRESPRPRPVPEDLEADVVRAEEFGKAIYLQDTASAMATDALFEEVGGPDEAGVAGWLAYLELASPAQRADSYLIEFVTKEVPPRIAYRIRVSLSSHRPPTVEAVTPPEALDQLRASLWKARQAAIESLASYPQALNSVILPAHDGTVYVYLLAATTKDNVAVLGRHHRIEVSLEDASIVESFPMSKSIMEQPLEGPQGKKVVGLWATHLVSDAPLESHTWASLTYSKAIYVSTSRGMWLVDQGKIAYLGPFDGP